MKTGRMKITFRKVEEMNLSKNIKITLKFVNYLKRVALMIFFHIPKEHISNSAYHGRSIRSGV